MLKKYLPFYIEVSQYWSGITIAECFDCLEGSRTTHQESTVIVVEPHLENYSGLSKGKTKAPLWTEAHPQTKTYTRTHSTHTYSYVLKVPPPECMQQNVFVRFASSGALGRSSFDECIHKNPIIAIAQRIRAVKAFKMNSPK